jgi:hypothetical protein
LGSIKLTQGLILGIQDIYLEFKMKNIHHHRLISLLSLFVIVAINISPISPVQAGAVTDGLEWPKPINLSHSGGTSDSKLIIDAAGHFHALWKDIYSGYVNSESSDGINWNKPTVENFPFGITDTAITLLSDSKNYIHAFWKDDLDGLSYSRVVANQFSTSGSWEKPKKLAESAINYDVIIDKAGIIHLAYLRKINTDAFPSGVYYRNSSDYGVSWSNAIDLNPSLYFRSLSTENANVKVSSSDDNSTVFVVWDNRQLKRIYVDKSSNGGKAWAAPTELKGPDSTGSTSIPFNIDISANGKNILILWQLGQANTTCEQYSQWSNDGGNTWDTPTLIYQSSLGCSIWNEVVYDHKGSFYLFAKIFDQLKILVWNGFRWSNFQNVLSTFTDPETFSKVRYSKQTASIGENTNRIYFLGNDTNIGGDTWLISISLEKIQNGLFPSQDQWSKPGIITLNSSDVSKVRLITDDKNRFHIFWLQRRQTDFQQDQTKDNQQNSTIYYSYWDGQIWSAPAVVIASINNDDVHSFDVVAYDHRLLLTWESGVTGSIYFSWADTENALFSSEWSGPKKLTNDLIGGSAPSILVSSQGIIYMTYVIPLNKYRGVYILKSEDKGDTWSIPVEISGNTADDWRIVDNPHLSESYNQKLNVIWTTKSLPGRGDTSTINTNHSEDGGITWGETEKIVEGNVPWVSLVSVNNIELERFWQKEDVNQQIFLWNQLSLDGGNSWSSPASPSNINKIFGTPAISKDDFNRIHLFVSEQGSSINQQINYLCWEDQQWKNKDILSIGDNYGFQISDLSAAISSSGKMLIVYVGKEMDLSSDKLVNALYYSNQDIGQPIVSSTPALSTVFAPTHTVQPIQIPIVTQTPLPIATKQPNSEKVFSSTSNDYLGLLIGVGFTVLIILAFCVYFLFLRKR